MSSMGEHFNFHMLVLRRKKKKSTRKTTQINDIPVKILKQNADIFSEKVCNFLSFCVNEDKFPNVFKQANIIHAPKKGYRGFKESYHPMSILSVIAKMIEKLLSKQETMFICQFLSK